MHDGSFRIARWDRESFDLAARRAEEARGRLPGVRPAPDRVHRRADRLRPGQVLQRHGRLAELPRPVDQRHRARVGPGLPVPHRRHRDPGGLPRGNQASLRRPGGRGLAGGIIVNLLTVPGFYDVALRDFGLLLGALTLARLAWSYDTR